MRNDGRETEEFGEQSDLFDLGDRLRSPGFIRSLSLAEFHRVKESILIHNKKCE